MPRYQLILIVVASMLAFALYWNDDRPDSAKGNNSGEAQNPALHRQAQVDTVAPPQTPEPADPAALRPAPPLAPAAQSLAADRLRLWRGPFGTSKADQVNALTFRVEPGKLDQLRTGQILEFNLSERGETVSAEVKSTANQGADVQIWRAALLNREPQDNLIIARGPQQTHITVFTDATTYSVVIDNTTGAASLVDEGDNHELAVPFEDGIALPEVPDTLPPL